jgi:hypothetical protein
VNVLKYLKKLYESFSYADASVCKPIVNEIFHLKVHVTNVNITFTSLFDQLDDYEGSTTFFYLCFYIQGRIRTLGCTSFASALTSTCV